MARSFLAWSAVALLPGALLSGGVTVLHAQDPAPQLRAARMTVAQGSVTVTEPGNAAALPGQVNLPLLSGVQVATGNDGQAEIEFEDGSVVRLTPNSTLSLDNLAIGSDGIFVTDMSLLHGMAYCELRATPQYSFVVNAGGDMLSPIENSTVRVNFDQPPASFAVLDGAAQIERQGGYQAQVRAGETLQTDATNSGRYFLSQGVSPDSWDQWNSDLDQAAGTSADTSTSVRDTYAGTDGYGWSDLDADGSWYNVPGQGEIWQPNVAAADASFDPYANGAWVWYAGTGYVWASSYSWGWTPYRCGNWSYFNGFGWGWAPGTACGGGVGWGFFRGGGNPVNIRRFPTGYQPIRVPTPRPGPLRPILPVRPYTVAPGGRPLQPPPGPRTIDGHTVSRIAPVRGPVAAGAAVTGSSLRRDFPVNPANHTHVLGVASTTSGAVQQQPNMPQTVYGRQPGIPPTTGNRNQTYPANGVVRPAPTNRPDLSVTPAPRAPEQQQPASSQNKPAGRNDQRYQQQQPAGRPSGYTPPTSQSQPRPGPAPETPHPTYTPPPAQPQQARPGPTSAPPPPQREQQPQRYTPPPQQTQPQRYTPPPQQQQPQRYTPPAQQAQPHPTYTPPPQPAQPQQHYTPQPSQAQPRPTSIQPPPQPAQPQQRSAPPPEPAHQTYAPPASQSQQQTHNTPK